MVLGLYNFSFIMEHLVGVCYRHTQKQCVPAEVPSYFRIGEKTVPYIPGKKYSFLHRQPAVVLMCLNTTSSTLYVRFSATAATCNNPGE